MLEGIYGGHLVSATKHGQPRAVVSKVGHMQDNPLGCGKKILELLLFKKKKLKIRKKLRFINI